MIDDNLFLDDVVFEQWVAETRKLGDAIRGLIQRKVLDLDEIAEFFEQANQAMERGLAGP